MEYSIIEVLNSLKKFENIESISNIEKIKNEIGKSIQDFSSDLIFLRVNKINLLNLPNSIVFKGNFFNSKDISKESYVNILGKCKTNILKKISLSNKIQLKKYDFVIRIINLCLKHNINCKTLESLGITNNYKAIFLLICNGNWILFEKEKKKDLNLYGKNIYKFINKHTNLIYLGVYIERGYIDSAEKRLTINHLINKTLLHESKVYKDDIKKMEKKIEEKIEKKFEKKLELLKIQMEEFKNLKNNDINEKRNSKIKTKKKHII